MKIFSKSMFVAFALLFSGFIFNAKPACCAEYYEVSLNSLVFVETEIQKVLEMFSRISRVNLFLDESVPRKKVTFFAQNMPFETALDMFVKTNGLMKKKVNKNTYLLYPRGKSADYESETISHVFILENDDPKKVINILKTIGKNTRVSLNERINGIVMIDTPENIEIAKKIVAQMDYKKPQVSVDLRLVEIKRDKIKDFGVQLDKKGYTISELKTFATIKNPAVVDLLIKENAAEILAQPKLKVMDQEKAEIQVGDRIPIEITTTSKAAGGDNLQLNKTVQWESVGIKLQIEVSKVHNTSEVTLKVFNEVSSVVEYTKEGYPHIRTRNARTAVRLHSGETVVIGGLINAEERTNIFKIPVLSKLPGFGQLFKNTLKEKLNTEIIMFMTPTVFTGSESSNEFEKSALESQYIAEGFTSETTPIGLKSAKDISVDLAEKKDDTLETLAVVPAYIGNARIDSVKVTAEVEAVRPPEIAVDLKVPEKVKSAMITEDTSSAALTRPASKRDEKKEAEAVPEKKPETVVKALEKAPAQEGTREVETGGSPHDYNDRLKNILDQIKKKRGGAAVRS